MRYVKNENEKDMIKELINMNRFSLKDSLLDAECLTGNRINNLDIDKIEYIVENEIKTINLWGVQKEKRTNNRMDYLIEADIYLKNDEIYRIKNWFGYIKSKNLFEDSEILTYEQEEGYDNI